MQRHLQCLNVLICLAILSQQPTALAGSAISVPPEARDVANAALAAAQNALEQQGADKDRSAAQSNAQKAEAEAADAQIQLVSAEKALAKLSIEAQAAEAEAKAAAQQAQIAVSSAAEFTKRAKKAIAAAKSAYQYADSIAAALKAKNADDWSKSEAAYARAERLNQIAAAADKASEHAEREADNKTALAETAKVRASETKQAVLDAESTVKDAKETALQANEYAMQAKAELKELVDSQDRPQGSHSFASGINFYRWRGDSNHRGWQMTQPMYYGYWQKDSSYGLYTKYIISQNSSVGAGGRVNTFSDTTLFLTKRNETPNVIVDYGLNINIPTGKSALSWSERYAMMNEDLVETSQFGKGWQFTPGIDVSWKTGKEDMWTLGASYTASQSYDPTTDIANDTISPGGEWRKFLRWQHAGRDWQFVGELINTTTGQTKIANGDRYNVGAQWDYRLTYNHKLPDNQNIMYYYWREHQDITAIVPSYSSDALAHFGGAMWSKRVDEQHVFRISFDVMKTNGSRYAGITNSLDTSNNPQYTSIDVDGRTKYTAGLGYDITINDSSSLSLDMQAFRMKDGQSTTGQPATTYNGLNVLVKYNKNL